MTDLAPTPPCDASLKDALLSVSRITDKALTEVSRLRRQRNVLARHLVQHRHNARLDRRELKALASEIHHLSDEVTLHQKALLKVAAERDDLRKDLAAERKNAADLVASLQADLDDARSSAFELDAKWRIALQAEQLAQHQVAKPQKAPWHARVSLGLERVAARILFGKGSSRSLEALDG